jgi:hypothetical protein
MMEPMNEGDSGFPRIGEEQAGEFARKQLEAARNDPRLSRDDGRAMMADFWDAMEEAERVRTLNQLGLEELTHALEREEERQGVRRDAEESSPVATRSLQAAWERAEWARAELANESPHSNAQALISMNSALDAMVEELVKFWREFRVNHMVEEMIAKATAAVPEAAAEVNADALDALKATVRQLVDERTPKAVRPKGSGIARYEKPLKRIGWQAPEDRPIPVDLNSALAELGALRDVLVHRAGRVDDKAFAEAPTLNYKAGQFVRITRGDYRAYSAAVRCYALEISFRPMRSWPEVSDDNLPDLANWRNYVLANA